MTLIKTQYNRRSFIKVSAASGGGMLLGFNWLTSCTSTSTNAKSVPKEWFEINAYIKIADNGAVTLYSPNPEIGQNIKTAMPLIVAEELDVDWKDVTVEQADLDTIKYSRQVAGGSQSIRKSWGGLRMAGATGRRMLMEAAAKRWQVKISQLSTSDGKVTNTGNNESLSYGELASEAALIDVPEEVELKEVSDFKLMRTRVKNVDGEKIAKGEPLFGLDYKMDGMQIAMIVHPPAFGMKPVSVDDTAAKSMPGITDVFTINSTPKTGRKLNNNAFPDLVAVVGKSTWQVLKAKKALKIEWAEDTELESSTDHEMKLKEAIDSGSGKVAREDGDVADAMSKAAKVVESIYSAPFVPHNPLEPMNFFADVKADSADLIGPIQTPESLRTMAAGLLELPEDKVKVSLTRMGGGFGRRLYGHFGLEAAAISKQTKTPIKLIYTREDDMTQGTYRPAYRVKYKAGLDSENNLIAFEAKGAGLPGSPLFENRYPAGTVENYRAEKIGIKTNISTGAWRAPRSNFTAGIENAFLDEVAEASGKDPIDFRIELFDKAIAGSVGKKNDYDPKRYAGVLKLIKEKANWGKEMPGVYRGVSAYYCHNSYVAQVVDIVKKDDLPVVQKVWCVVDCGIVVNMEGALNQVEGGIVDGIGTAMYGKIDFVKGVPQKDNFGSYKLIKHSESPIEIESFFVENDIDPTGLGEPSLPPIIGALANALYKATGKRFYDQPFSEQV
ncbi:MAG: xanthine dehydrogenase family protein molybdopterin-binding subunit [Cyclobacteriaceae bacterium]